jgi:hypothetical protein
LLLGLNFVTLVEVLALLETYRIKSEHGKEHSVDFAIRVCQAVIASMFGYAGRADWTDDIQEAGLIDYSFDVDANDQYKALTELVKDHGSRDATGLPEPGPGLSGGRKLDILFELLELIRKEAGQKFHDWKDADDWLFSELDITKAEVDEIYRDRGVMTFTASCKGGTESGGVANVSEQGKAASPLLDNRRISTEGDQSDIALNLSDLIESSITLGGFEVLEGGRGFLIARHGESDTDFEIKMEKLAP